jgi:hypothetical protein
MGGARNLRNSPAKIRVLTDLTGLQDRLLQELFSRQRLVWRNILCDFAQLEVSSTH